MPKPMPTQIFEPSSLSSCSMYGQEDISFYRPDGSTERKSIQWCLDNDFYKIEEGLWSGDWYYKRFPEDKLRKEEEEKERLNRDPREVEREFARERYNR
jgi:hypothetical protein